MSIQVLLFNLQTYQIFTKIGLLFRWQPWETLSMDSLNLGCYLKSVWLKFICLYEWILVAKKEPSCAI